MPGKFGKITKSKGKKGQAPRAVYLSDKFGLFRERTRLHVTTLGASGHKGLTEKDGLIYWMFNMLYEKGLKYPDR